jgi:hypothetical protein
MTIIPRSPKYPQDVIDRVQISKLWRALGGQELHRGRGRAFWRRGNGWNVSINEVKKTWYDHAAGEGGGLLDLVARVRGGGRQESLRWLADLGGVKLDDSLTDRKQRAEWARERKAFERDLRDARYWRRGAVALIESDLAIEKSKLFDSAAGQPDFGRIDAYEAILGRVRDIGDLTLVEEYRAFKAADSRTAAAFIRWAKAREQAEVRALEHWFQSGEELAA